MDIIAALQECFSQLGRTISSALTVTDRQRINISSTSVLYHGVLTNTSWTELYEVPENTRSEVKEWFIANNEDDNNYVDFAIVPKGESPSDDHMVIPNINIYSDRHRIIPTNTSIIGGWKIYARARQPNRIVLHISGTEIVN